MRIAEMLAGAVLYRAVFVRKANFCSNASGVFSFPSRSARTARFNWRRLSACALVGLPLSRILRFIAKEETECAKLSHPLQQSREHSSVPALVDTTAAATTTSIWVERRRAIVRRLKASGLLARLDANVAALQGGSGVVVRCPPTFSRTSSSATVEVVACPCCGEEVPSVDLAAHQR